jgi:single-stranded-DNA-specific exonuclease
MEVAAVWSPVTAEHIGFRLGPRLTRRDGWLRRKRLCAFAHDRRKEAEELATLLDTQNRDRQTVERKIREEAEEKLTGQFDPARDAAIVLGSRDWHPGVLGMWLRLARKYHRPTVLVAFDAAGLAKGSGRSIEGLSLVEALGRCEEHLEKFGGHEMAAGLAVRDENFTAFADAFRQAARELLSEEDLQPRLHLDHELTFPQLNGDLLRWHQALEPFGSANRQPTFFARGVEPAVEPQVLKEKHLVLRLRQQSHFRRAIFFDGASAPLPKPPWDVAFRKRENTGETRLQIQVEALRAAGPIE